MAVNFISWLIKKGVRVFTFEQANAWGTQEGISVQSMLYRVRVLEKAKLIERLTKGLYCIGPEFTGGVPIHEFEIARALIPASCIGYLSAFAYHHLTDQISATVYVQAPSEPGKTYGKNLYTIRGIRYKIVRIKKELMYGIQNVSLGNISVAMTDLEKTLIDGLIKPKYCGGFREVLNAYSEGISKANIYKLVNYAQQTQQDAVCKRLGYILSTLQVEQNLLSPLMKRTTSSYALLNPNGPHRGPWNSTWLLRENL